MASVSETEPDCPTSRIWIDLYAGKLVLDDQIVPAGTPVRAVDVDGKTVGAGTVDEGGKFGFMPVYGDDPTTDDDEGLKAGETFYLEIDGTPTTETWSWNPNNNRIELGELRSSDEISVPNEFRLYDNYPNPFNPTTTIKLALPEDDRVTLSVFNILGRKIAELFDGPLPAGIHTFVWDGNDQNGREMSSGIYFYRVITTKHNESRKMLLLK